MIRMTCCNTKYPNVRATLDHKCVEFTPCTTRTFSVVLPRSSAPGRQGGRHGAVRIVMAFPNRPTVTLPRIGLPGFYTGWADAK
jgi:hypothetical protein